MDDIERNPKIVSLNRIVLYSLFIFLCWIWLNRADNEAPSNSLLPPMLSEENTQLEKSKSSELTELDINSEIKIEQSTQQCPFPITFDTDGAQFELFLSPSNEYEALNAELNLAVQRLFNHYARLLDEEVIAGVRLNVLVLSPVDFDTMLIGKIGQPSAYSGVYFAAENLAVVKYVNFDQALATAVHEVTHAINFSLFGQLPRFLNEGLAETAESHYLVSDVNNSFDLPRTVDKQKARDELLDFYSLMHSEHDWHSTNNSSLYLSGSAWAHFLLSSELGLEAMKLLLQQKYQAPCQSLMPDQIIETISQTYPNFEQEFYYWFDEL